MELNEIRFLLAVASMQACDRMSRVRELAESGPQPEDPVPLEIAQIRAQGYYAAWSDCNQILNCMMAAIDEPPEPL